MKKILVVEDDPDILTMMSFLLNRFGYSVEQETIGSKVVSKVLEINPGLILLDFNLPEINGDEICKVLKSNSLTQHIPVILVSAVRGTKEKYKHCGFCDFIEKPFNVQDLKDKVDHFFPK